MDDKVDHADEANALRAIQVPPNTSKRPHTTGWETTWRPGTAKSDETIAPKSLELKEQMAGSTREGQPILNLNLKSILFLFQVDFTSKRKLEQTKEKPTLDSRGREKSVHFKRR